MTIHEAKIFHFRLAASSSNCGVMTRFVDHPLSPPQNHTPQFSVHSAARHVCQLEWNLSQQFIFGSVGIVERRCCLGLNSTVVGLNIGSLDVNQII